MNSGTGIAGAMSYQPREASSAPNACATCGKDLGEGGRTIAAAIPGTGLVQYCSKACAPTRSPAEEWQWMVDRIRALEEAIDLILPLAKGYAPPGQSETARRTCRSWIEHAEGARAALAQTEGAEGLPAPAPDAREALEKVRAIVGKYPNAENDAPVRDYDGLTFAHLRALARIGGGA